MDINNLFQKSDTAIFYMTKNFGKHPFFRLLPVPKEKSDIISSFVNRLAIVNLFNSEYFLYYF